MSTPEEDGSEFEALLGGFGTHTDVEKRARAERMAAMRPNDGRRRRGPVRAHQFNVRITNLTQSLAKKLCEGNDWSQADLVEAAIAELAKQKGVTPDA
jgi:hypothetical protein